jgi:hypothetical protein
MATARPLPATGEIFLDARGADRALRVSWHYDTDLVVLSLWRDNVCTGSFRLTELLRSGLETAYAVARSRRHQVG